jgi:hypothetical protein
MLLPAVPGLKEVDDVEGQDENTTEVDAFVDVIEDAGRLQRPGKPAVSPFFEFMSFPLHTMSTPCTKFTTLHAQN